MKEQRVALGILLAGFVSIMGFAAVTAHNDMQQNPKTPDSVQPSSTDAISQ